MFENDLYSTGILDPINCKLFVLTMTAQCYLLTKDYYKLLGTKSDNYFYCKLFALRIIT